MSATEHSKPADLPSPESTSSFWHKEPSPLLLGHRSTRHLPESADVVIVGSGMTGASAAHHLLADAHDDGELKVVMLEAREACWGATGRNGGHCQPVLFEHPSDPSIGSFELKNFYTLKHLIEEKSIDCEFVVQPGVRAIYSQHILDELAAAMEQVRKVAPQQADMMRIVTERDELNALRIPTALGAVVTSVAGRMWPYKFVSRILEDLLTKELPEGKKFNLQTLTPVKSISQDSESGHQFVHTSRGSISARKVILATNGYTSHLLPSFASLIVPCRGQMSALFPPLSLSSASRLTNSYGFLGDGIDDYLIQRPSERGEHLMFGGGRQHGRSMGTTDDNIIEQDVAQYLRSRLIEAFNLPEGGSERLKELKAEFQWTGVMGYSRDDLPWVGPVPAKGAEGLFMAAGYTGHGMPNTWLCGKAVAVMVAKALDGDEAMEGVLEETGLPKSYLTSADRVEKAMAAQSVESKDWAEMERGRLQGLI